MLSYRHAFHAGNHADVLKHVTLVATLQYMLQKDSALQVIDTHAGAGLYRLDGDYSVKAGEAADGVLKWIETMNFSEKMKDVTVNWSYTAAKNVAKELTGDVAPALQAYLDVLLAFNKKNGLKVYPGSPLITQYLLRNEARDKLKLFEMHPTDYRALIGHVEQLQAGRMVAISDADGFASLKTLLPPPATGTAARRSLVIMDPSYEIKSDYALVSAHIADCMKRFSTGTYMVWYPIIPRAESHDLPRKLKSLAMAAKKSWLHATLNVGQEDEPVDKVAVTVKFDQNGLPLPAHRQKERPGLRESGMFLINPPHTLKAALQLALPQVLAVLGRGRGKGFVVEGGG